MKSSKYKQHFIISNLFRLVFKTVTDCMRRLSIFSNKMKNPKIDAEFSEAANQQNPDLKPISA